MPRRVMIAGANGQLGWELQRSVPGQVELWCTDSAELDIADREHVLKGVSEFRPDVIINAAAYTAVDRAEQENEAAYRVNRDGARHLAEAAVATGARLLHVSTDFVFDGNQSLPYSPDDIPNPRSVYGASKLAGEHAVSESAGEYALIVRTSWVYSAHGNNFVKTMLRLMAERETLGIVADQVGTPTWAAGLAKALWTLSACAEASGILHWSDAGVASWYDFAVAIQEEALTLGLLKKPIQLKPIRTQQYPTPAQRPAYSVMDKSATWSLLNHQPVHWRVELRAMLRELTQY